MRFDSPLDDIFLNRSHVRVLGALYRLPEGLQTSGREMARRAGVTHPTALKALGILVDTGLVKAERSPAGARYELNRDHLFAGMIADLYKAEADVGHSLASFIRDQLLSLTNNVEWATIFGSVVSGESVPVSDVDLAVCCGHTRSSEVERVLYDLSDAVWRRFGNRLNPVVSARKQRPKTGIWKRLETEGVALIRSGKPVPL